MRRRIGIRIVAWIAFALVPASAQAQLLFDKTEYAARRAKVMERIGSGVAILLGAKVPPGYNEYFQNNDFLYLTGVEIPDAVLVIDGALKETTLYFTITDAGARNEGISLDLVRQPTQVTGIERVAAAAEFGSALARVAASGRTLYTMFKPEELMRQCSNEKLRTLQRNMTFDPWDGRLTREQQFVQRLRERFTGVEVRDLSPIVWELRTIKSPAEIAHIRKAAQIAARATTELIKATRAGMFEYELAALYEYLVKKEGANDLAYYMIISSGENHPYVHYYKHDRKLESGDILVVDVGPDYGYYDIDITVTYPANGVFTPRQKEVYEAAKAVHEANMQVYRPGLTVEQCRKEVEEILRKKGFDLTKDYFTRLRGGFGHFVGLAVHDVGGSATLLKPGMVFANEPMVIYPNEKLGVRVEDTILITETGCENLTAGIPREVAEIEALMKQPGIPQLLEKATPKR